MKKLLTLYKENVKMSGAQMEGIKEVIANDENWKNVKSLINISLVSINETSIIVNVEETDKVWHVPFIRIIHRNVPMNDMTAVGKHLFVFEELEI
ncbi:MAG: hypothetical protein WDZ91_10985 [Paenibacillaceae bacterium]